MKCFPLTGIITGVTTLLLSATPLLAAYTQPASTISAGGGISQSAVYENRGVVGQATIVGSSTNSGHSVGHGFLAVLGDGFRILFPVIALDKGSISFVLASNSGGSDALAIGNAGGSTLNWSISKAQGSSWLTTTPASGSGAVSVGINVVASGLNIGSTYHDTLTISGTGIQQTAQVQLSLTVTAPVTYRLTVTVVSNNASKGGGNINNGTGLISCSNTGSNPATATGTCQADLPSGSSITLLQTPDSDSTVATRSGNCGGTGNCGVATIAADTSVTATFPYSSMAKVNSTGTGYEALALAYAGAAATDTIKVRAVTFPAGDWLLNGNKAIVLRGGLDAYYATQSGHYSTLNGKLTISNGSLVVDKLIIK
jgi:hypothetical protein